MPQPGRTWDSLSDYRYGFNGMETDPEVKEGKGQHYTSYFRQYDPRLGRWWSNDPVVQLGESPYAAMFNNPIGFSDPFGDCPGCEDPSTLEVGTTRTVDGQEYVVDIDPEGYRIWSDVVVVTEKRVYKEGIGDFNTGIMSWQAAEYYQNSGLYPLNPSGSGTHEVLRTEHYLYRETRDVTTGKRYYIEAWRLDENGEVIGTKPGWYILSGFLGQFLERESGFGGYDKNEVNNLTEYQLRISWGGLLKGSDEQWDAAGDRVSDPWFWVEAGYGLMQGIAVAGSTPLNTMDDAFGQSAKQRRGSIEASGYGDLTVQEVREIQSVVDEAGRPLTIVGSAASGTRRGVGTISPIGKGPGTRSDIDYLVGPSSLWYYQGLESKLPSLGAEGVFSGTHNSFMGPGISFAPGVNPIFIP